jgi:LEA14-like dessication related protein
MKMNYRALGVVALAVVVAAGCFGHVKRPEVTLSGVRVGGVGLRGASLIADLDISNQNDVDIETDSIAYELFASTPSDNGNWSSILKRTYTQRIKIEEDRTTRVEIPIDFDYSDLAGPARSILDRGTFNYQLRGNVYLREPLRKTLPFTKTGNVSLSGAR